MTKRVIARAAILIAMAMKVADEQGHNGDGDCNNTGNGDNKEVAGDEEGNGRGSKGNINSHEVGGR